MTALAKQKITVFASKRCGACAQVVPAIRELAKRKGMKVKVVDVDNCHTEECDAVKYTPLVKLNQREISLADLAKILKDE